MPRLFGRDYTREELLQRVGDMSQLAGVRYYELHDGIERGVRALDFWTGSGLTFTVLVDRGMDIGAAAHSGRALAWRSSTRYAAPQWFEARGHGWLRTFPGGLLATCGLTSAGAPSVDEGEELGLHGRIANLPASHVRYGTEWRGEKYILWAEGEVCETRVFGEHLVLRRRLETALGENVIRLYDVVENRGHERAPLMLLYHINPGFPVVNEGAEMLAPDITVVPRDDEARKGLQDYARCIAPTPGFREQVFRHEVAAGEDGRVTAALVNRAFNGGAGLGLAVRYYRHQLPYLWQWRMMGEGTYVVGIEPANCDAHGRARAREEGTLQFLEAGSKREFALEFEVLTCSADVRRIENEIATAMTSTKQD